MAKKTTQKNTKHNHGIIDAIRFFIAGFFIGAANIVPGVSGGTIALVAGVYEDLIGGIKNAIHDAIKLLPKFKIVEFIQKIPWVFFGSLGIGGLLAFVSLSSFLENALENSPIATYSFFFGLILASVAVVLPTITKINVTTVSSFVIGAIGTYLLLGAAEGSPTDNMFMFFVSGIAAIVAMILPGLSGSLILLMLGTYRSILEAVNDRDFIVLGVVVLGVVFGLAAFSNLIHYVFNNYKNVTLAVLSGVMLGSLRKVWPWFDVLTTRINSDGVEVAATTQNIAPTEGTLWIAIIFGVIGFLVVIGFEQAQKRLSSQPKSA